MKRTKKVAAAPYVAKQPPKKEVNPLIEKRPKNFGIGEEQQRVDEINGVMSGEALHKHMYTCMYINIAIAANITTV